MDIQKELITVSCGDRPYFVHTHTHIHTHTHVRLAEQNRRSRNNLCQKTGDFIF